MANTVTVTVSGDGGIQVTGSVGSTRERHVNATRSPSSTLMRASVVGRDSKGCSDPIKIDAVQMDIKLLHWF
jgi:hypothetical protein